MARITLASEPSGEGEVAISEETLTPWVRAIIQKVLSSKKLKCSDCLIKSFEETRPADGRENLEYTLELRDIANPTIWSRSLFLDGPGIGTPKGTSA